MTPQEENRQVFNETDFLIDMLEAGADPQIVLEILKGLIERSKAATYAIAYPETMERMM